MCNVVKTLFFLSFLVTFSECHNILVVFPHYGKSHFLLYERLLKVLASRGNNVTVISYFPQKRPIPNYRDIPLELKDDAAAGGVAFNDVVHSRLKVYAGVFILQRYTEKLCKNGLENEKLHTFLKEKNKFDVILLQFFISECFMGMLQQYDAPVIGVSSNLILTWFADLFGNPSNPSYTPDFSLGFSERMTFFERLENTFCQIYQRLGYKFVVFSAANKYSKKYLQFDLEKNRDIFYNTSLLLVPTHFSSHGAFPLVPNIIEVGGIHIESIKELPQVFSDYINSSSDGVIYFSMGSTLKGHTLPKEHRDAFLKNFGRLPQRVIWKWENETMEGKPDNVLLSKWTPQIEILCSPNVKAFIYHGGLLSSTEAVYCGIPQIILPQFGDQFRNAKALESIGLAVVLDTNDVSEENVKEALLKVLHPEYQRRAKEISQRFRDRPLPPLDTAIYWIEYVIKHKGAPFMQTAAVKMPLYQYLLLDVIAFLLVSVISLLSILYYVFSNLYILVLKAFFKKKKLE